MLERAIRLSLLVTSVLCSTVHPPPLSLALELRRAPPADTRRAGLSGSTPACARTSPNVCTLYLVFKEPRPRRLSPSGAPAATASSRLLAPIRGRLPSLCDARPPCQPLFSRSAMDRFRTVRPASGGFQGAYLAARALDRGHRVKRVSPIYEHRTAMSTPPRPEVSRPFAGRTDQYIGNGALLQRAPVNASARAFTPPRFARGVARAGPSATPRACPPACRPSSTCDGRRSPARR